jgi:hypothetical protein
MLGLLVILISKSWDAPPWGRACLSYTGTHAERGGLFISARVFFPCMMSFMDGWKASRKTNTTSFTIHNHYTFSCINSTKILDEILVQGWPEEGWSDHKITKE